MDELKIEQYKLDIEEAKAIANDIKQNLKQLNFYGKKADSIVKGKLQHSSKSEGQKEFIDINALCDEFRCFFYHGLKSKDKSFNATLKQDFNSNIGNIHLVPKDIGRVMMNLLSNAF